MRTFAGLARSAASHLQGPDQRPWHDRLERDHDNLRKALDRAGTVPDPELAVAMAFDLWRFWQQRGYLNEGRARLEAIEARHWDLRPESRARLYEALGGVAYWQADEQATSRWYGAALEIRRELGDPRELANALYNEAYAIGVFVRSRDFTPEQRAHFEAGTGEALAIYRELGDRIGEANVQWGIGTFYYFARDPGRPNRGSENRSRSSGRRARRRWKPGRSTCSGRAS